MLARSSFRMWDSPTMVPQGRRRTGLTVDPVALLKREHDMILDQLAMIETAMSPRSAGSGVAKGPEHAAGTAPILYQPRGSPFRTGRGVDRGTPANSWSDARGARTVPELPGRTSDAEGRRDRGDEKAQEKTGRRSGFSGVGKSRRTANAELRASHTDPSISRTHLLRGTDAVRIGRDAADCRAETADRPAHVASVKSNRRREG